MSEISSESSSRSADASIDEDRDWSLDKVLFYRDYLMPLYQWPLAEACILLLEKEDLLLVQMLWLQHSARYIASSEFREESIMKSLGLIPPPAKLNPLQIVHSKAVEAIRANDLPAKNSADGEYYVRPTAFLSWAKGELFHIPDGLLDEANVQFSWEGMGYSATQRLFIQKLFAQVLLNGEDFRAEKSGRIKIAPLVEDMAKRGLWPDGMEIRKNKRWWNELTTDLLAVYQDKVQQNRPM